MKFTKEAYLELINYYYSLGYRPHNIDSTNSNNLIIRHDVDYSLSLAHRFAEFEAENGILSNYYILMSSDFYNPGSLKSSSILHSIIKMGHSIGLHFDESKYDYSNTDELIKYIYHEKSNLEEIINMSVTSLTFHRPINSLFELPEIIDGMINLYSKRYFNYNYFSDSRRDWRRDPFEIYKQNEPVQLLVHPIWFETDGNNTIECLNLFQEEVVKDYWHNVDANITNLEDLKNSLSKRIRILITGAGAPGAYGIIRALRKSNIIDFIMGIDIKNDVATSPILNRFEKGPSSSEPEFIAKVIDISKRNNIDLILPLVTSELLSFSSNVDLFEERGIKVIVISENIMRVVNNKRLLLEELSTKGIRIPKYQVFTNAKEFKYAVSLFEEDQVICFKPTVGNGSRGFRIIDPKVDELRLMFDEKPNQTYITKNRFLEIIANTNLPEMLLMDYLPGNEYSVDIYLDESMEIIIPRRRVAMNSGISVENIIEYNIDVIEYCKEIVSALKLSGVFGIQIKMGSDGKPYILEINPRLQGTVTASVEAGANIPLIAVESKFGISHDLPEINWGLRMIRHWDESYFQPLNINSSDLNNVSNK